MPAFCSLTYTGTGTAPVSQYIYAENNLVLHKSLTIFQELDNESSSCVSSTKPDESLVALKISNRSSSFGDKLLRVQVHA
jgi:hypothetical protein